MSKSGGGMGEILKLALLAGGGYYLYTRMTAAAPAAAGAPAGTSGSSSLDDLVAAVKSALGVTPAAGTPTAPPSSDGLVAELKLAAKGNTLFVDGKGTPFYWNYYRNILHPPVLNMGNAFGGFDAQNTQFITAEDFVAGLKSVGLAGLGAVPIVLPQRVNMGGRMMLVVPRGVEVNAEAINAIRQRRGGVRVLA